MVTAKADDRSEGGAAGAAGRGADVRAERRARAVRRGLRQLRQRAAQGRHRDVGADRRRTRAVQERGDARLERAAGGPRAGSATRRGSRCRDLPGAPTCSTSRRGRASAASRSAVRQVQFTVVPPQRRAELAEGRGACAFRPPVRVPSPQSYCLLGGAAASFGASSVFTFAELHRAVGVREVPVVGVILALYGVSMAIV